MPQIRTRDDSPPAPLGAAPPGTAPADTPPPGAGALYRQHLDRFPERRGDTALERAARALIRAAQIRLKAPPKAD